jgi:hypothetical protein
MSRSCLIVSELGSAVSEYESATSEYGSAISEYGSSVLAFPEVFLDSSLLHKLCSGNGERKRSSFIHCEYSEPSSCCVGTLS